MMNIARSKRTIVVTGVFVIAIALVLFLSGGGQANAMATLAFVLLAGLAFVLLVLLAGAPGTAPSVEERLRKKPAERKKGTAEPAAMQAEETAASADPAAAIIADTAGELRTSVEVIQEELEEILDEDVPADKEHMQSLYEETDRLRKIIDGMEQMSRAQALARTMKKEPVQVARLLSSVVERVRAAVENSGIEYTIDCEPGLVVESDTGCLDLMITNIADNAARSIRGTGKVALSAKHEGKELLVAIADTGSGIKRAHIDHIFERFFRGTGHGVGMGLAVVKELVDACGGKIQVQTAVGKGTTFTLKLPG